MKNLARIISVIVVIAFIQGCANIPINDSTGGKIQTEGYLAKNNLLDAINLLTPPPKTETAAFRADEEAEKMIRALRNTPRWKLATQDVNLTFPQATEHFSCALNIPITAATTPHIHNLMLRTRIDVKNSIEQIKEHYQRPRPFMVKNIESCFPPDEPKLRKNGSFPSGHTATGWVWALILTEIAPERADLILRRGHAFGYSRLICAVHWVSDIEAGFTLGAGITARLHAEPQFRYDLDNARAEFAAIREQQLPLTRDCTAEANALATDAFPWSEPRMASNTPRLRLRN